MTQEEKAKAYDKALNWMRELYPGLHGATKEDAEHYFPELRKIEDERIRRTLVEYFGPQAQLDFIRGVPIQKIRDWLEKQKEQTWIPTDEQRTALGMILKHSNPDADSTKVLESLLDDLTKIANPKVAKWKEKQKEQKELPLMGGDTDSYFDDLRMTTKPLTSREWFDEGMKYAQMLQKEQNREDEECTDFTIYHPLKNGKGEYKCVPYNFYGSLTSFSEDKDLIDFLRTCFYTEEECNEWIKQQKEQKPAEWSEEDEKMLVHVVELLELNCDFSEINNEISWLKSLSRKKIWNKEDERILKGIVGLIDHNQHYDVSNKDMLNWLKSLRPSWKPSEEQEEPEYYQHFDPDC